MRPSASPALNVCPRSSNKGGDERVFVVAVNAQMRLRFRKCQRLNRWRGDRRPASGEWDGCHASVVSVRLSMIARRRDPCATP